MLGIKLVEVDTSDAGEEQTGTCELCFGSMWCDNPILIFENPNGDRVVIYGYYWSWGDYFEIEIGNYLNFSDWLSKQKGRKLCCKVLNYGYTLIENKRFY